MVVRTRKETLYNIKYNKEASVAALLYFFERDNGKVQDAATWTYYLFLPFEPIPPPFLPLFILGRVEYPGREKELYPTERGVI